MFEFKDDLKLIMNVLDISSYDLSFELGFDVPTISNWLNGKYIPDKRSKEDIYEYAYSKGVRLNDAHMEPLENLSKKDKFKLLFHGSKQEIKDDISLDYCKDNNDLGKGFYLGETINQSSMFVSEYKDSHVYGYGLFINKLKVYEFNSDLEWLLYISYNRGLLKEYADNKKIKNIINKVKNVDVIISPIADNRMFTIIDEFINGMISDKACIYALEALDLGKQYCLKTDKAISRLGYIREFYLCKKEKEDYINKRNELNKNRMNKIKNFRSKNKEGKYINEIL